MFTSFIVVFVAVWTARVLYELQQEKELQKRKENYLQKLANNH